MEGNFYDIDDILAEGTAELNPKTKNKIKLNNKYFFVCLQLQFAQKVLPCTFTIDAVELGYLDETGESGDDLKKEQQ